MSTRDPSPRPLLDSGVLSRLSRMPLQAKTPMLGPVTGTHRSATRGASVEFAEYRKYVAGDDIKHIDWQVYARSDRFYIKEFEADTNLRGYLVLDCSGSMAFDSGHGSRFDYARSLAAHLAYMLVKQGDAVGLHLCGQHVQTDLPARQAPSHLQNVFHELESVQPRGESTLIPALHGLAERVQRRAQVVVLTDALMPADALLDAVQHLCFCRHEVTVFQLIDPQELRFDFTRPIRFVDLEGGADLVADPSVVHASYLQALERHNLTLRDGFRKYRVDHRLAPVHEDFEQLLTAFLLGHAGRAVKGRGGARR